MEESAKGIPFEIYDSTLYDFKLVKNFKSYFDMFLEGTQKFSNALVILSHSHDKYVVRDYYMANLAKLYTCWDVAYINCPTTVDNKAFDFILTPDDLPTKLTEIIHGNG